MAAPAMGYAEPKSRVELRFACKHLQSKDLTSKSDPFCVLHSIAGHDRNGPRTEIGRTEVVKNNEDPEFAKSFVLDYFFERLQWLCVVVYDSDGHSTDLSTHDLIGEAVFTMANVASSGHYSSELSPHHSRPHHHKKGVLLVSAEPTANENAFVDVWLRGEHLDKKDFFGKSDPYFEFHKQMADGSFVLVHRSEVIKNTLNPVWNVASVGLGPLCGGDVNRPIRIDVYDWDMDGSHDLIGSATTSVGALRKDARIPLVNPKKKDKKGYANSGELVVNDAKTYTKPTFLDYIMGGCELNFTVAVDFTGSNGDQHLPESLHFLNPGVLNAYESAIISVGSVIEPYDTDRMFPALGFGCKIGGGDNTLFDFPLNLNFKNPYCAGINGILEAYRTVLPSVKLWGPTNFTPVISHVSKFAAESVRNGWDNPGAPQRYYILLIITDGEITDFPETIQAIVDASRLPMSIIIVGVGAADFSAMNALDGDNGALRDKRGVTAERDIVQFVAMRDFYGKPMDALAQAVLAEIPGQVVDAFQKHGVKPRPRPAPVYYAPPPQPAPTPAPAPTPETSAFAAAPSAPAPAPAP